MDASSPAPFRGEYQSLVSSGAIEADPAQAAAVEAFAALDEKLARYRPARKQGFFGRLFSDRGEGAPNGLYVHGEVGRGKTMLMDLFFQQSQVRHKRRAHFHEFMADVHERIYEYRQRIRKGELADADVVQLTANAIFDDAWLLCFDEFHVTDIADAMILSRLFTELFQRGSVLVATSNVEPDNLYRDGLNRQLFLPFIDLLRRYTDVVSLDSPTDYRLEKTRSLPVWLAPLGPETDARIEAAWHGLTDGVKPRREVIEMKGRQVPVPMAAVGAARFSFRDLCEKPLGASDYLAIAERYPTVFIEHIPVLTPQQGNETKRFINLIDTLYDNHVRLVASAEAMPEALLPVRRGTTGFEFDRTVSRLFEMRSQDYLGSGRQ